MGGSLMPWALHGVLLLNTILTVERDKVNSHRHLGWQALTAAIVKAGGVLTPL
jgi:uracil-DNA glycosylase